MVEHRSLLRLAGFLSCLALAAACGGSTTGSSSGSSGDGGPALAPGDFQASVGPIDVQAGVETTVCIVEPLGNTEDVVLQGFDSTLLPGSHHLIVYLTSAPVQSDPVNCSPFTGLATGTDTPLALVAKESVSFKFPDGVAQEIPANANVKVEAHYINTTGADLQGNGTVTFHTVPKASAPPYQAANWMFWGTTKFSIPPNSQYSTGPIFQVGPVGAHYFLATTHQHRLGSGIHIWGSAKQGDMSNLLTYDEDWSNPAWKVLSPTYDFDGTNGLTYQCDWDNTTDQTITFGESALDEMCFVGGYYYPSMGFQFCLNGHCGYR